MFRYLNSGSGASLVRRCGMWGRSRGFWTCRRNLTTSGWRASGRRGRNSGREVHSTTWKGTRSFFFFSQKSQLFPSLASRIALQWFSMIPLFYSLPEKVTIWLMNPRQSEWESAHGGRRRRRKKLKETFAMTGIQTHNLSFLCPVLYSLDHGAKEQ